NARYLEVVLDVIERRAKFAAPRPSPWAQESRHALQAMHRFLTEFGLTPAARSRLSIGGEPDNLKRFFGQSG
ncbi:MAG TPA: P27 family phage terminase small subunit, partial [Chloroflexia bacterium]|nr:P27 family phage terminase small subunit [Chloroflexia bacterium]